AVVKALTNADTGSLGFRDPRIDLQPGQIVVNGRVTVAVFPVPIQVIIVVPVRDGQATPTIAAVRLGPRDAGEPIRRAVEALLAPHLAQLVAVGQGVFVETVTITETEIRIEGRPRRP
ncbi:MAG: hypothetical protein N2383_13130, partial [Caldilineales bacterium]|nr:hypothetical protein [Caldilineales bacterium]